MSDAINQSPSPTSQLAPESTESLRNHPRIVSGLSFLQAHLRTTTLGLIPYCRQISAMWEKTLLSDLLSSHPSFLDELRRANFPSPQLPPPFKPPLKNDMKILGPVVELKLTLQWGPEDWLKTPHFTDGWTTGQVLTDTSYSHNNAVITAIRAECRNCVRTVGIFIPLQVHLTCEVIHIQGNQLLLSVLNCCFFVSDKKWRSGENANTNTIF